MIDEDSSAGHVNTCFQEQSRQGVTQSTRYNTGFLENDNTFFHSTKKGHGDSPWVRYGCAGGVERTYGLILAKRNPGRGSFSISWDSWFRVRQRLSLMVMHRIQALWTH